MAKPAAKPSAEKKRVLEIDFEGVESGGGRSIHIPEGDYCFKVAKIEAKKGEESGKPYLLFHQVITKGHTKGVGKTILDNFSLQKQSLWKLRNFLEAAGKTVPSSAVKIDLDKLIGLETAGTVNDDEYNGKTKSAVGAYFPIADFASTGSGEEKEESGAEGGEEETETEGGEAEDDESEDLFS